MTLVWVPSVSVTATDGFNGGYRRWRSSRVHAELIGDGLPAVVEPFSFVPLDGLQALAMLLGLAPGRTLVDLGCGRGGPGLWLSERTGARLVGVDGSEVAIADALQRRPLFPHAVGARFHVADVTDTRMPASCADAVVAIDVLQLLDEPAAMLQEAARLLRPCGRLALTTWEGLGDAPARFPRELPTMIEDAGLIVDSCIQRPDWLSRQLSIYQRAAQAVKVAPADPAVRDLANEGRNWQAGRHHVRRVMVAAHLPE